MSSGKFNRKIGYSLWIYGGLNMSILGVICNVISFYEMCEAFGQI